MALTEDELKALQAELVGIFEHTILPLVTRCAEIASSVDARVEAVEARCARVEQLLQCKSGQFSEFELKRVGQMIEMGLERGMRPSMDRVMKFVEEAARKNTMLAQYCLQMHDENCRLKSGSIMSIGKPS
jgi:hypothetical protein